MSAEVHYVSLAWPPDQPGMFTHLFKSGALVASEAPNLYLCETCGAGVFSTRLHTAWHSTLPPQDRPTLPSPLQDAPPRLSGTRHKGETA